VILVLGLAGIPAIWLAFAWGTSPMDAWRLFSSQLIYHWRLLSSGAGDASDFRDTAVTLTAVLPFFLAPFVSLAQLSRCLGRSSSIWERRAFTVFASVSVAGCLAAVVLQATSMVEYAQEDRYRQPSDPVVLFVAFGIIVGALIPWFRTFRRHRECSAECMLMGAYIGGVALWAALLVGLIEPTAVAAEFTGVVYAVSLWRRLREYDAAE
jgi:hypothetical protein